MGTLALSTEQGRAIVDRAIGLAWDRVFDTNVVPMPASPDTALAAARTLFVEKAALGAASHLLAVAAEANANIKHMGVGYLAAFLADLAGFQRLAQATMGEVETAALAIPMRRKVNRDYRPNLPPMVDLTMMYAKKQINSKTLDGALAEYGYGDEWIHQYEQHLFLDPRLGELVRIGQYFNPSLLTGTAQASPFAAAWIDERPWLLQQLGVSRAEWDADWFYYFRAAQGGYNPADVRVIVETAKRAVVRREQTLMLDAITRLFREEFIGPVALRELTEEAWGIRVGPGGTHTFVGDPVAARVRATEIRTLYSILADRQEMALQGFSRGLVSEAEVLEYLQGLGMPPAGAQRAILRERLGLVPRTRLAAVMESRDRESGGGDATPNA